MSKGKKQVSFINLLKSLDLNEMNTSPIGEALMNPSKIQIASVEDGQKQFHCEFCKHEYKGKLIDHITRKHPDVPEVKRILDLPVAKREKGKKLSENQILRQKLVNRSKFKLLIKEKEHQTKLNAASYRCRKGKTTMLSDLRFCSFCFASIRKTTFSKHLKLCTGVNHIPAQCSKAVHNLALGDIHPLANEYLRRAVCKVNNDEIGQHLRHDEVIIRHGNALAMKYRISSHHNKQIRSELRLGAKVVLEAQKTHVEVKEMKNLLHKSKVHLICEVGNSLGKFQEGEGFKHSATTRDIGRIIEAMATSYLTDCIMEDLPEKADIEEFLQVFRKLWGQNMTKIITESDTTKFLTSGPDRLPSGKDISLLREYANKISNSNYIELLNKGFDYNKWINLGKGLLVEILILNRRRPLEVSRLRIVAFLNAQEKVTSQTNPEMYSKMSKKSRELMEEYTRVLTRGKKNKKISPVLLNQSMCDRMHFFINNRRNAGVDENNPFVFGVPKSSDENQHLDGGRVLGTFAEECGATFPNLLKCTKLRKHVATIGVALSLTDGKVENLARYLGHSRSIHEQNYRQNIITDETVEVAKFLEMAQMDYEETPNGIVFQEEPEESPKHVENEEFSTPKNPVKRVIANGSSSSCNRRKYDEKSKDIIRAAFKEKYLNGEKISNNMILDLIRKNPCLSGRKLDQIRSFLQYDSRNEVKKNISDQQTPNQKRNTVPTFIYTYFKDHIENQDVPSVDDIIKVYSKSPTIRKFLVADIQEMVRKAMFFDSQDE